MDEQTSSLTRQFANNKDSEHALLHEMSGPTSNTATSIQPSRGAIISRRCPQPLSAATTRLIAGGIAETPNLSLADILEHIGNIDSASSFDASNARTHTTQSLNSVLDCYFPPRLSRSLQFILQRPLLPALGFITWNGSTAFQVLSQPPASLEGNSSQDESTDHANQRYEESILYMLRLADSSLEGSISLTILPAGNTVNFRLSSEEQGISFFIRSLFFYISDTLDRYRDMRLDVDNMSYEELLALEDHIGNVSTGLSEETLSQSLKHCKYFLLAEENAEKDTCSICQENYIEDDDLGALNCGHRFHAECIKQWLRCKNLCPVCKSTGLCTTAHMQPQLHQ